MDEDLIQDKVNAFKKELLKIVAEFEIQCVVEEVSKDALKEQDLVQTVCEDVCSGLGISVLRIDLDRAER